jgi:hypothetical protein
MRNSYLICYDISDEKRLRKVFKAMRGYGTFSRPDCGLGGAHGHQHADGHPAGFRVALTPGGRRGFFRAYELKMDTLVTHPIFEYRVSYRRVLEIQARLLARCLEGEIGEYPVFVTR